MLSWKDYYAQEQVRQDRLREAKQQRLVSMFIQNLRKKRKIARDLMLEQIGYRLVQWGDALLRRVADRGVAG